MTLLEIAKLKNRILRLLVDNKGNYTSKDLYEKLGESIDSREHFDEIVKEFANEGKNYINGEFHSTHGHIVYMSSNHLTEEFLNKGGFINMYQSELEADLQAVNIANQEQTIRDLTEENLTLSNQVASMKLKTYLIPLVVSITGALIAIGSLWYAICSDSNTVSKAELQTTIQKNVDSLRIDFKKENEKLKSRIYEAEMLIAIYESDSTE